MNRATLTLRSLVACGMMVCSIAVAEHAQAPATNDPPFYGLFNGVFLADGEGLKKSLAKDDSVLRADSPWSLYAWVRAEEEAKGRSLIAGAGDPSDEYPRYLATDGTRVMLWMGRDNILPGGTTLTPGNWHLLVATSDGVEFKLYSDGSQVAHGKLDLGSVSPVLLLAPSMPSLATSVARPSSLKWQHFGGKIADLNLLRRSLRADEIQKLYHEQPDFSPFMLEEGSKAWPLQTRGQAGYRAPQDAATMPHSKAAYSHPVAQPLPAKSNPLRANGEGEWTVASGSSMIVAPKIEAAGETISQAGFNSKDWLPATVPGTALTTLIDRGIYPDPDYGLNNLAIPESLNKQDYWYRVEFKAPQAAHGLQLTLTFHGINYKAP